MSQRPRVLGVTGLVRCRPSPSTPSPLACSKAGPRATKAHYSRGAGVRGKVHIHIRPERWRSRKRGASPCLASVLSVRSHWKAEREGGERREEERKRRRRRRRRRTEDLSAEEEDELHEMTRGITAPPRARPPPAPAPAPAPPSLSLSLRVRKLLCILLRCCLPLPRFLCVLLRILRRWAALRIRHRLGRSPPPSRSLLLPPRPRPSWSASFLVLCAASASAAGFVSRLWLVVPALGLVAAFVVAVAC